MCKERIYPQIYVYDFSELIGSTFSYFNGFACDIFTVIDKLLDGSVFSEVYHRGNPKYLNMGYKQIAECLSYDDKYDWIKTKRQDKDKDVDSYELWWTGKLLALFQWYYSVDFKDWLKYFSSRDVYNIYYPLHEASFENAASKLYENYRYKKQHKEFRKDV